MAIKLKTLLKLANFPEKEVDELMVKEEYLKAEEKFKLANTAWFLISQQYFAMLNFEKAQILEEIKHGKRKFNPNDFEEIKARLIHELVQKLEASESKESIEEVRKELEKHLPQTAENK